MFSILNIQVYIKYLKGHYFERVPIINTLNKLTCKYYWYNKDVSSGLKTSTEFSWVKFASLEDLEKNK